MRDPGEVPAELKWLVAHAVSASAGCRYCQAHTAANSEKAGLSVAKIEALMEYETNAVYSPPERAAVALALAAGQVPNTASREHFDALRPHFSESGIVEIVAVISLFGWLNRWNDTLASDLEAAPLDFANTHLGPSGWSPGKHVP
jgi:alkylhydroperoxidase family enzyme